MLSSPAALWIPNAWFYEVGRGALSCCLSRTPISVLIHYLWRIGTHRPRNTHSPLFYCFFAPAYKYFRVADGPDCCQSSATSVTVRLLTPGLSHPPHAMALTPCLSPLQVSRGHEAVGGPGCRSEQLKQTWAEKSRMASAGSASSTSPVISSFATTTTGNATSTSRLFVFWQEQSARECDRLKSCFRKDLAKKCFESVWRNWAQEYTYVCTFPPIAVMWISGVGLWDKQPVELILHSGAIIPVQKNRAHKDDVIEGATVRPPMEKCTKHHRPTLFKCISVVFFVFRV